MKTRSLLLLLLLGLIILNSYHIFYFNIFTHSLPFGIYRRIEGIPQRGDFAATCLTRQIAQYGIERGYLESGNCPTGGVPVLKKIYGIPGDHYLVKNGFLELNGNSYPIMDHDSSGRQLKVFYKQTQGVLDKGRYILLSDFVPSSWDSRYWGAVSVQFLLKPFWIFEQRASSIPSPLRGP